MFFFQASLDLGTCRNGFGFGGTGKKSNSKSFDEYGEAFGLSDTIGCYLDMDKMEISFSKNGTHLGKAFDLKKQYQNATLFPAVVLKVEKELHFVIHIIKLLSYTVCLTFCFLLS